MPFFDLVDDRHLVFNPLAILFGVGSIGQSIQISIAVDSKIRNRFSLTFSIDIAGDDLFRSAH